MQLIYTPIYPLLLAEGVPGALSVFSEDVFFVNYILNDYKLKNIITAFKWVNFDKLNDIAQETFNQDQLKIWNKIYKNKDNLGPEHIAMFMDLFVKIWKKDSNGNVIGIGFPVKYVPGAYYSPQEYQVEIYTPFSEALYLNQIK